MAIRDQDTANNAAAGAQSAFAGWAGMGALREMGTKSAVEKLRCLKCKKDGTAKWQEAAEPRKKRKLIGLSAGFKSIDKGGREGQLILCADCGSKITSA